jgi:Saccharopine dehydrogenase C-terminal domain
MGIDAIIINNQLLRILASLHDGAVTEYHTSTLKVFGDEQHTAMSKTVGYTTAASVELILNDSLTGETGLLLPTLPKLYLPILDSVGKRGIQFKETTTTTTTTHNRK